MKENILNQWLIVIISYVSLNGRRIDWKEELNYKIIEIIPVTVDKHDKYWLHEMLIAYTTTLLNYDGVSLLIELCVYISHFCTRQIIQIILFSFKFEYIDNEKMI